MKISICTVTARRGFVELQARMLAKQTFKDIEWVLVDFAYEERVKTLQNLSKELGLKIIHSPNVRNDILFFRDITRNRNKCLKLATGDAVIFLDDYACVFEDFVEKHVDLLKNNCVSAGNMFRLERNTDGFVYEFIPDNIKGLFDTYKANIGKDFRNRDDKRYKATGITYTGNLGIPRIVFEHLNGFDPRLESGLEDCDIGARASIAHFETFFNPEATTLNLSTGGILYTYSFDHSHDVEPFIKNPNNHFKGDDKLKENEFMAVEFFEYYRIATCKVCGAKGMIDPNEVIHWNLRNNNFRVPLGLAGGYK